MTIAEYDIFFDKLLKSVDNYNNKLDHYYKLLSQVDLYEDEAADLELIYLELKFES